MSDLRPDVPPLSDLGRQRIRQSVFDRLDREAALPPPAVVAPRPSRRRTAMVIGLVAAVAAVVAVVVATRGRGSQRSVASRQPSPSRLETGDSPSEVTVGDARITAGPHAALTVSEAGDAGVTVFIERGAIDFAVSPRGDRPPFVVMAADVRVEVVGTVFSVARDGDQVAVSVAKGVVRVIRAGDVEARVAAGESWPPAAASEAAAPEAEEEAELTFEPQAARTARARRKQPEAAPQPPAAEEPVAPRDRYEAAARVEKSRPEEALAAYRALAAEGGAWADNALFAQGRLELELGRKDAARRSLGAYLK